MPAVGAELCGQVAFGGDPLWVDAGAVASGHAHSAVSGVQRLPQWTAGVSGAGEVDAALQRLLLPAADGDGFSAGLGRFIHLVSVSGEARGNAGSEARVRRLVQHAVRGTGEAFSRTGLQRLVQSAADAAGDALAEALFQRSPQFRARTAGTARAWFLAITVMGGASQQSELQRIVQHAAEAAMPSTQASRLMRVCPCRGTAAGGSSRGSRASLRLGMRGEGFGSAVPAARLAGVRVLAATAKAQVKIESLLAVLVPLCPLPGASGSTASCNAQALARGIGPALSFPATAPESGVIFFEVET